VTETPDAAPGGRPEGGARRSLVRARLAALLAGAVAALAAWGGGLAWFAAHMPDGVDDPLTRTDAIVVLTGGAGRLGTGLDLLAAGRADKLFVSGVYRGVDVSELLRVSEKAPDPFACCIDLGHDARDTVGNAAETAHWMAAQGFRSLRLVTANYHLPRSLLEFRRAMPEIEMIPHPVFPAQLRSGQWWWRPKTALLIVGEYNKYLVARLRHGFSPAPGPGM
jgi:uncharacterized SAM-binding protein YcdF (DUF218 family)